LLPAAAAPCRSTTAAHYCCRQEFMTGVEQFGQQAALFANTPIPVSLLK
jgi:hypothetical protein